MIHVERVSKVHRRGELEVCALREISCHIPAGAFTFILGPSGSGKSTLLYLIGALDQPSSGEIRVGGISLQNMTRADRDAYRRKDVGFVFQNFNLLANLTAVENVLIPFLPSGVSAGQKRAAADLLDRLGLGARLDHRPAQLSGGEQQRVAIARALLKRPKLVLADEPTGELDSVNSLAILQDLRDLCQEHGSTVVIVTHEQEYVQGNDLVVRIRDGRVAEPVPA
ncbi:ABC transporter ATP-binding protein [Planctellipticum variicoloris]|uniref:ABC transporter ATP-binding protein n=1 Tax=Planctellipticum variicoloris TaxID=3064265 RepID=UPI0030132B03|nr:ABC transporter ATP-binding protein [Planctomycetaceae bacterium SH412]